MIYTKKIQKAIKFATKTHNYYRDQRRKGKYAFPYVIHPLAVGLILTLAGAKENLIVAGILHDTIEDSDPEKKVTPKIIEEKFGRNVKTLVSSVTEFDKDFPWIERKALALKHIRKFSHDSVLLKSADILSNGREVVDGYSSIGDAAFKDFKASKIGTVNNYNLVIEALLKRWPESPLAADLKHLDKEIKKIQ